MKTSDYRWMICALFDWFLFQKQPMVKIISACQNNHSTCFAPKTGLNGLRKMPVVSHLWGIKQFWENKFVGGWFIQLSIDSYLKIGLGSRRYFSSKSPIQPILHPDRKMIAIGKIGQVLKKGLKYPWENSHHFSPVRDKNFYESISL